MKVITTVPLDDTFRVHPTPYSAAESMAHPYAPHRALSRQLPVAISDDARKTLS
ncbi:hypothetical protein [Janibacter melonis]|uniref:hypothetical protein n=1 Tax=Janibacter melonis TaxID=262209 RepID=UPI001E6145AF|nr:hypothetical protein [Janibacter melonis]MCB5990467.1 hypothetical protein [Janibacter melonis]